MMSMCTECELKASDIEVQERTTTFGRGGGGGGSRAKRMLGGGESNTYTLRLSTVARTRVACQTQLESTTTVYSVKSASAFRCQATCSHAELQLSVTK